MHNPFIFTLTTCTQALLPGAAMILMAQATAAQLTENQQQQQPLQLENASIPGPLALPPLSSSVVLPVLCCSVDPLTGQVELLFCVLWKNPTAQIYLLAMLSWWLDATPVAPFAAQLSTKRNHTCLHIQSC
jgi:hypothetical protein